MDTLLYIGGIAATFIIVVGVHEAGHFFVARKAGVFVEKFSIGFGKPLFSWKDKLGTEYCLAVIPFGGYVKMYGEDPDQKPLPGREGQGFADASPTWRVAIAAAGPAVNLVMAVLVYWALLQMGFAKMSTTLGAVEEGSAAWNAGLRAGERVISVDGRAVEHWQQMAFRLVTRAGDTGEIMFETVDEHSSLNTRSVAVEQWLGTDNGRSPTARLGMYALEYLPLEPVLYTVAPDTPAAAAGLQDGDRVISVDGVAVESWQQWVDLIRQSAEKDVLMRIERMGQELTVTLTPRKLELPDGTIIGQAGVAYRALDFPSDWPDEAIVYLSYGPVQALSRAGEKVVERVWLTLRAMKKMITGDIALENLSGPITIARVAGQSASYGLESFLEFLAFFSLSLGVLNLLPIPVLDGGHIVFHGYEAVAKKPLPLWIQAAMMRVGLAIILCLAAVALYYDFMRVL